MASVLYLPEGFGQTNGGAFVTKRNLYLAFTTLQWVSSVTGSDANSGALSSTPKATVFGASGALSVSADRDIIVLLSGHTEVVTATYSLTKDVIVAGCGTTRPRIQSGTAGTTMLNHTGLPAAAIPCWEYVEFRPPTAANIGTVYDVSVGVGAYFRDCVMAVNGNSDESVLLVASGKRAELRGCTVVSESLTGATVVTQEPISGAASSALVLNDCVFDGGTVGIGVPMVLTTGTEVRCEDASLVRGALFGVLSSTGYVHRRVSSGSSGVLADSGAVSRQYADGIGAINGPTLATGGHLTTVNSRVRYVYGPTGNDAVATLGEDRSAPLATMAGAYAVATDGDIIVFMVGHAETISASVTLTKRLHFVGEGRDANGEPTVTFTCNVASGLGMWRFNSGSEGSTVRGIRFPPNAQANSVARLRIAANAITFEDSLIECGPNDTQAAGLEVVATTHQTALRRTKFRSTSVLSTVRPYAGLWVNGGGRGLRLDDVTFDGGTVGWSVRSGSIVAVTVRGDGIRLLNGSDVSIDGMGYVFVDEATGGGLLRWEGTSGAAPV